MNEATLPKTFGIKNRYLIVKDLWPGTSCDIKLAEDTQEKKLVTLKIFNKGHVQEVLNNCKMMKKLEHPNVLKVLEFGKIQISQAFNGNSERVDQFYAIEDHAANSNLLEKVQTSEGVSEMVGRFLFKQMLEGVQSCHFKGICHRSLSLKSFLLDSNFNVKLRKFSNAKSFREDGVISGQCGEKHCQPPEMQAGILYQGKEVDIFQLGVCLFQMITGVRPFENALPEDKYYKCIAANRQDIFFDKHLKD